MGRNANNEGSVYPWRRDRKQNGYKGAISYKNERGETKRYVAYGPTRAAVRAKLDAARDRLAAGAPVRDAARAVGAARASMSHGKKTAAPIRSMPPRPGCCVAADALLTMGCAVYRVN